MTLTLLAGLSLILAGSAMVVRHVLSARDVVGWETLSGPFRAVLFISTAVILFLGFRLIFAATDGVNVIPPDASRGYAMLAFVVGLDKTMALVRVWRQHREMKAGCCA